MGVASAHSPVTHSIGNTTCDTQVQPRHTGDATHPKPCFEIANTNAQEKLTTQSLLTVTALETGHATHRCNRDTQLMRPTQNCVSKHIKTAKYKTKCQPLSCQSQHWIRDLRHTVTCPKLCFETLHNCKHECKIQDTKSTTQLAITAIALGPRTGTFLD